MKSYHLNRFDRIRGAAATNEKVPSTSKRLGTLKEQKLLFAGTQVPKIIIPMNCEDRSFIIELKLYHRSFPGRSFFFDGAKQRIFSRPCKICRLFCFHSRDLVRINACDAEASVMDL